MARLIIETRIQIPPAAVDAIVNYKPPGKHGHRIRKNQIGDQRVDCGTLTLNKVMSNLKEFEIPVDQVIRYQDGYIPNRQIIYQNPLRIEEAKARANPASRRSISTNLRDVEVEKPNPQIEKRKPVFQFDVEKAKGAFTQKLCDAVGETRGKVLGRAAAFVSDMVNHLGSEEDPRQVFPWHLVSIKPETSEGERKYKVSLGSLDNIAPKVAKAIWDYVHVLERGRATLDAASQDFENALWQAISPDEGILDTLKNLANPQR